MNHRLIRTFIAIPVPESVFNLQGNLKETILEKTGKVRWVRQDQLHLTIKFVGDTPDESIDEVRGVMQKVADQITPFDLSIQKTGCFPKIERPRVMWIGLEGALDQLNQLVEMVHNGLHPLGFPREEKNFHPHITLARAKYPQKNAPDISSFLNTSYDPIPFQIEKFQFISSELFPNGPVYTILSTHFFGNNSV
ncbi:MAG: RNA 2',3'-cyclic phosphodiesterase [Candidatus Marinimicrobia bacterium]|nr:RNA 2',3'-cyclic phosphodiesterase [Candidatus Neomarinimicrobiota bacterium]MBL7011034.1 RNA 2',3'-cyclic phosphodiesterase [Candidatus Neomarinimicrobiota bacterium]MBL7029962.1 RNA 2',3'-cyclic phosphodiesterase [Candidatus Neomarinimicrobiota bacterium]